MSLPHILIASRISTDSVGGLASYQRHLATELESRGIAHVSFFCGEKDEPPSLWMRLASRPWTHRLLEGRIERHYLPVLEKFRSQPFDVVHFVGTGWDFTGFAMHALARSVGAHFTIWPAVHPGQWGDDRLDLRLYNKADAVLCQSKGEADVLVERGLQSEKIVHCGLAPMCRTDGDPSRARNEIHIENRPAVLFLGRRDAGKGYPILLQAWRKVLETHPTAVLILGGPGGTEYENALRSLPPDTIRDLAIPSERALADALAACDIFCMPSAHESFGIVYVEAWSYGKPVICGSAPASRELVTDGKTGLWAEQTAESVADAIVQFLNDETGRLSMGEAGQRLQREHFTWEKVLQIHQDAFGLSRS